MVRQYRYIDFQDRKEISTRYLNGDRVADIADGLGMATATVYRELKRGETGGLDRNQRRAYGTLVTDCGIQLIAAAVMEGKKINITDLAVGDGGGSYYKPNSTMTALKGEKWRGKVNRVEINEKSPNMIDVVAVIPSDVGGWTIREMGVLDETEKHGALFQ